MVWAMVTPFAAVRGGLASAETVWVIEESSGACLPDGRGQHRATRQERARVLTKPAAVRSLMKELSSNLAAGLRWNMKKTRNPVSSLSGRYR